MKISGFKAMYYGGSVIEKQNDKGEGTGEFDSYLSFVQINDEKNKMEQGKRQKKTSIAGRLHLTDSLLTEILFLLINNHLQWEQPHPPADFSSGLLLDSE